MRKASRVWSSLQGALPHRLVPPMRQYHHDAPVLPLRRGGADASAAVQYRAAPLLSPVPCAVVMRSRLRLSRLPSRGLPSLRSSGGPTMCWWSYHALQCVMQRTVRRLQPTMREAGELRPPLQPGLSPRRLRSGGRAQRLRPALRQSPTRLWPQLSSKVPPDRELWSMHQRSGGAMRVRQPSTEL